MEGWIAVYLLNEGAGIYGHLGYIQRETEVYRKTRNKVVDLRVNNRITKPRREIC
jgi:hypothetical protein